MKKIVVYKIINTAGFVMLGLWLAKIGISYKRYELYMILAVVACISIFSYLIGNENRKERED